MRVDSDSVPDLDLVARPGRRAGLSACGHAQAGAAKLRCSGRRQHRGTFFLSCLTQALADPRPPVTTLATSSGVHRGPQPGKRRARLAPWQPPALPASLTARARSCATPADARVAGLVDLATTEKPKSGFTAAASPPSPKGGFGRPVKHNAGGLCALVLCHCPSCLGRRHRPRVRLRPHNPHYVQRAAAANCVRCKVWLAPRCSCPARPAVLPRRLQPLARLPFPPGQARHPSAPVGLPKPKDKAKSKGRPCLR